MKIPIYKVNKKVVKLRDELDSLWLLDGALHSKTRLAHVVRARIVYCYIASLELKKYGINNIHIMSGINKDHSVNTHYLKLLDNYIESGNIPEDMLNYLVMYYSEKETDMPQWLEFFKHKMKKSSKLSEMNKQISLIKNDQHKWDNLQTSSLSGFLRAKYSELLNAPEDSLERIKTALEQKIRFEVATSK